MASSHVPTFTVVWIRELMEYMVLKRRKQLQIFSRGTLTCLTNILTTKTNSRHTLVSLSPPGRFSWFTALVFLCHCFFGRNDTFVFFGGPIITSLVASTHLKTSASKLKSSRINTNKPNHLRTNLSTKKLEKSQNPLIIPTCFIYLDFHPNSGLPGQHVRQSTPLLTTGIKTFRGANSLIFGGDNAEVVPTYSQQNSQI